MNRLPKYFEVEVGGRKFVTDAELLASPQPVVPENQGVDQWPSMNTASITDDEGRAFLIRPAVCRRESGKVLRYPLAGGFLWTIIPKRFL